jgi:hypothetical protein
VLDDGSYDDTVPAILHGKNVLKLIRKSMDIEKQRPAFRDANNAQLPALLRSRTPVIFRAKNSGSSVSIDQADGKTLRKLALERLRR